VWILCKNKKSSSNNKRPLDPNVYNKSVVSIKPYIEQYKTNAKRNPNSAKFKIKLVQEENLRSNIAKHIIDKTGGVPFIVKKDSDFFNAIKKCVNIKPVYATKPIEFNGDIKVPIIVSAEVSFNIPKEWSSNSVINDELASSLENKLEDQLKDKAKEYIRDKYGKKITRLGIKAVGKDILRFGIKMGPKLNFVSIIFDAQDLSRGGDTKEIRKSDVKQAQREAVWTIDTFTKNQNNKR